MFSNLFENLTAKLIRFTKEIYTTVNKNEEYVHDFKKEPAASKNQVKHIVRNYVTVKQDLRINYLQAIVTSSNW